MQVYVQDYGVIDFRPEEVYRFDGKAEHTQLRGSIRTNPNNDWVSHNYWYDLRDVLVAHSNDLNLVIGLPVLTWTDLEEETQRQEKIEKELSNILVDIKEREQEFLCNKCGKPLSKWVAGEGVKLEELQDGSIRISTGDEAYFGVENLKEAYDTYVDKLEEADAADDTDIEEEIQRVLKAMRELDLEDEAELSHYRKLVSALGQLKEIQKYI